MPYKLRDARRHKFSKARYKINNWPDYNEALKQRGNITIWFSTKAISLQYPKKSKRRTRGAQTKYSDIAIETGLLIKSVAARQGERSEGAQYEVVVEFFAKRSLRSAREKYTKRRKAIESECAKRLSSRRATEGDAAGG